MTTYLPIGDFSRATRLSVKTLRHYHQLGLLEPADVDTRTGYRRYTADQIPIAQVIRRFRELEMPLDEIRSVLSAPDLAERNARITSHLERLEEELGRTQRAVTALRGLLDPAPGREADIELRSVPETPAAAITASIDADDVGPWFQGALGELYATLDAQRIPAAGCAGGIYSNEIFTAHRGQATIFIPCDAPVRPLGRVAALTVPAAELAVLEHDGSPTEVDWVYRTLATYVAAHAIAVDGPLREYYVVGLRDTPDVGKWRTAVGWPVFGTGTTRPTGTSDAR